MASTSGMGDSDGLVNGPDQCDRSGIAVEESGLGK
jgi:hypothetical protein